MSRALDKDTLRAVGSGNLSAAYEAISKPLAQTEGEEHGKLLEIELLGKSHLLEPGAFLLQDENALAISKLGLVQAFFAARLMFHGHHSGKGTALSPDQLLAVTNVILLMDPEHLTAANSRKRLVWSEGSKSSGPKLELIRKDKFFVDSLLTSRLHRHTKSPTLWSHRRWLVEKARIHGIQPDVVEDLKSVVMTAAERHPRNYYAWCHARWLTGLIPREQEGRVLRDTVDAVKGWCFRNHTDTSGWSFLSFVLAKLDGTVGSSVLEETCKFAASFQWTNESTWVFLRTLATSGAVADRELLLFLETLNVFMGKLDESPGNRRVLEQAKAWYETYRRP